MEELEELKKTNEDMKGLLSDIVNLASNEKGAHFTENSIIIQIAKNYVNAIEPT